MNNASAGNRSTHASFGPAGYRGARSRAAHQALVNNIAVAGAFLFVSAVIVGLV